MVITRYQDRAHTKKTRVDREKCSSNYNLTYALALEVIQLYTEIPKKKVNK